MSHCTDPADLFPDDPREVRGLGPYREQAGEDERPVPEPPRRCLVGTRRARVCEVIGQNPKCVRAPDAVVRVHQRWGHAHRADLGEECRRVHPVWVMGHDHAPVHEVKAKWPAIVYLTTHPEH